MSRRAILRAAGWVRSAILVAVAGVTLLAIGRTALGTSALLAGDHARAARIDASLAAAYVGQATEDGASRSPDRQIALSKQAIALAPLNAPAFGILAEAFDNPATTIERDAALRALPPLGWRDPGAQYQLLRAAYRLRDWPEVVLRADALLRQGFAEPEMLALLRQIEPVPAARTALIKRLALSPAWRARFLTMNSDLSQAGAEARVETLRALAQGSARPSRREVNAFVSAAIAAKRYALAKAVHEQLAGAPQSSNLLAGGVREEEAGPFDWSLSQVNGAEAWVQGTSGTGDSPRVEIAATGSAQGLLLRRTMLAPPGDRVFTLVMQSKRPDVAQALTWQVRCLSGETIELEPQGASASGNVVTKRQRFRIPPGCPAQAVKIFVDNAFGARLEADIIGIDAR